MNKLKKLYLENTDLLERVENEKVTVDFAKKEDVLMMFFDGQKTTDTITVADGLVVIHFDPSTYKIMGFTIPYYKEYKEVIANRFVPMDRKFDGTKIVNPENMTRPIINTGMAGLSMAF